MEKIEEAQNSLFKIENTLKKIVLAKKEIGKEPILEFGNLITKFEDIGNIFFEKFNERFLEQIITFGAISTTADICKDLRDNLESSHERMENPIFAEKILDKNYLLFMQITLDSLNEIFENNEISNENFMMLNESIKNLVIISEQDGIYKIKEIKFTDEKNQQIFLEVLKRSTELEI